jgi:hypothetical protein
MTTRSRAILSPKGLRTGRLRSKERTIWVFCAAFAAATLSSVAERFDFLEVQFHFLEKSGLALRTLPKDLAPELLVLELEIGDRRFMARAIRLPVRRLRPRLDKFAASARQFACRRKSRRPLGKDHRVRGSRIGGQRFRRRRHVATESYSLATAKPKPAPHVSMAGREPNSNTARKSNHRR